MEGIWGSIRKDLVDYVKEVGLCLVGNEEPSKVLKCGLETRGWIDEGEY